MKTAKQEKGHAKPFSKKTFYLDLKSFRQENNLAQDIKILGGKQESFLSKEVSFVVSDRISLKHHLLNLSARKSNTACPSPQLFNDSVFGLSPLHLTSPGLEQDAAPMSRGLALLQKARLQTKGTGDIMEVCKQWNIKVYHVQKVLSWIEKYKNLYRKYYLAWVRSLCKKIT
ncbi:protein DBF4 homolog B-like, partial [Stegodyphus dumicola]|uniref:protein DBF4 homolog B-like n=1 Tax=Stegodyphus dumicola TaxID=202533 RepID=UPI0015A7F21A